MAEPKKVSIALGEKGITAYAVVKREADGYILNDADGSYAASPADPYLALTEHGTIKGLYEASESRQVWADGRYTAVVYKQAGASPDPAADTVIGSGEMAIRDDKEVYLDALPSFVEKWVLNRLVEDPVGSGTWKLYDDDDEYVLKTWNWNNATKTRSKAT